MASRRPLVLNAGRPAELPAGDTLKGDVATVLFVIDGGGSAIPTGTKVHLPDLPADCTVVGWTLTADASTTSTIVVRRATYANFPTFTEISASEDPALSAAQKNQDLSLSTWTTALSAGDVLEAEVTANNNAKRLTLALRVTWS